MVTKDEARQEIVKLVEQFRQHKHENLNEAQTRHSFILPLFQALGWNIHDSAEMSAEEQVSRGFVDFGFYLNAIPVFYLETKRASEKLENPAHMKQAINYSFLKGVTWAVLTDFEQLMVFNAELETKDPREARLFDLHCDHYTDGQFEDLWYLSKPSLMHREIDRQAERFGKKNKKEPVTDSLFKNLAEWRRQLFNEIRGQRATLWTQDPREVDNAVQRLLDRLIFIRTVEDREVEPPRLQALKRQSNNKDLFPNMLKLFRELNGIYNSNLFAEAKVDLMEVHDPGLLKEIIDRLYHAHGGFVDYDFNAISADVLGAVYEQYLSFRAQDPEAKQAIDIAKRQKRKQQGIYYTPQFVVRYIVRQTLGKLLENGADAHQLRILDPACGSGAFLIEAFDVLDKHLEAKEPHVPAHERRLRILTENLYGVDLDEQAVEVTRLNLMLRGARQRDKLPLLKNIVHGNSLIEDDSVAGQGLGLKWEERFPDVIAHGGFDVVIGNPPYGATISQTAATYLHTKFAGKSKSYDTFEMFLAQAENTLTKQGCLGMIIPSSWLTSEKYVLSRTALLQNLFPTVAYAMPFDVFHGAYIDTAIVIFSKTPQEYAMVHTFPKKEKLSEITEGIGMKVSLEQIKSDEQKRFSTIFSDEMVSIFGKLKSHQKTFGQLFDISRGVQPYSRQMHTEQQIKERFLHANSPISENHLPELQGEELSRYWVSPKRVSFLEYSDRIASSRPMKMFQGKRIVLRRLLTRQFRLQASYTDETMITTDNVLNLVPVNDTANVLYGLGFLNSRLISWFYVSTSMIAQKDDFPQVHISALKAITIPDGDKARHDRMVELVDNMLRLKREHAAANVALDDRRHDLQAQIDNTDKAIDALVYELYGLSEEEIKIVEGKN